VFVLPASAFAGAAALAAMLLPPLEAAFAAGFAALAIAAAAVDLARFEIPDWASGGLLALGLANALATRPGAAADAVIDAAARAVVAAAALLAVRLLYRRARGIEGLGLGDVKLAGALGPWLVWQDMPTALLVGVLAALAAILARAAIGRTTVDAAAAIPFGAFLAPAAFAVFLARAADVPLPFFG
jgi:leader peptidase (prepilin peptidase)/N-methyltransferase